jgi:guanosine-3',5'-bis(diphosphate) 3'-pyrophosphohydrolase
MGTSSFAAEKCSSALQTQDSKLDISAALNFAQIKHQGQIRELSGLPYVNHPISVSHILKSYTADPEILIAALLHDTLEDTRTSFQEIENRFGNRVASLVQELTSDKQESKRLGKAIYLSEKMLHMSDAALLIKLADRLDNISDLTSAAPTEFSKKYLAETFFIIKNIIVTKVQQRNLLPEHQQLADRILFQIKQPQP